MLANENISYARAFNDVFTDADFIRGHAQPCSFAREAMIGLNTHNTRARLLFFFSMITRIYSGNIHMTPRILP
jgi:hypothetical protein